MLPIWLSSNSPTKTGFVLLVLSTFESSPVGANHIYALLLYFHVVWHML